MKKITILTLLTFTFLLFTVNVNAQREGEQIDKTKRALTSINVNILNGTTVTPADLVQSIIGTGITPSNVSYTGANVASGLFTGGILAGVGLEDGVILSSGFATNIIGPNQSTDITGANGLPGDSDLNFLSGQSTFDASVLEFDFEPTATQLEIRFVFGSEEYLEFVNSGVNDAFGFFLDGVNIALVPNTTIPITIDDINNISNSSYYIDNASGIHDTEMDGFTTLLIGTATVVPGNTHHIKLAIADGGDDVLDSWVLIEGESFGAPPPPTSVPLSDWAIYIAIMLIGIAIFYRFKTRIA